MKKINKILLLSTFIVPCFGTIYSCNNDNVTIIVTNEDDNKGTINGTSFTVKKNSYVKLQATPKTGYLFTGWYIVNDSGEHGDYFESTYYHLATQNITFKAKWEDYSTKQFVFDKITDGDNKDTYKISNYFGGFNKDVVISKTHHGVNVTTIGKKTFYGAECKSITIPDGINHIENYAFGDCNVASVTLPTTLTTLGDRPFYNWKESQYINIYEKNINRDQTKEPISTTWGWAIKKEIVDQKIKYYVAQSTCAGDTKVEIKIID